MDRNKEEAEQEFRNQIYSKHCMILYISQNLNLNNRVKNVRFGIFPVYVVFYRSAYHTFQNMISVENYPGITNTT